MKNVWSHLNVNQHKVVNAVKDGATTAPLSPIDYQFYFDTDKRTETIYDATNSKWWHPYVQTKETTGGFKDNAKLWMGTKAEYDADVLSGVIDDNTICFTTDEGTDEETEIEKTTFNLSGYSSNNNYYFTKVGICYVHIEAYNAIQVNEVEYTFPTTIINDGTHFYNGGEFRADSITEIKNSYNATFLKMVNNKITISKTNNDSYGKMILFDFCFPLKKVGA